MFWIGLAVGVVIGDIVTFIILATMQINKRDKNIMQKWQNSSKQLAEIIKIIDGTNCMTCCPNGEKKCDCFYDKQCDGLTMSRATKLWDAGYRKVSKQTLDELRAELQNEFNE